MATHPPLNKTQRDVLFTLHEPRIAPMNHVTLNYLRALGLVTCQRLKRTGYAPGARARWTITDLGMAAHRARPGTPISPALLDDDESEGPLARRYREAPGAGEGRPPMTPNSDSPALPAGGGQAASKVDRGTNLTGTEERDHG